MAWRVAACALLAASAWLLLGSPRVADPPVAAARSGPQTGLQDHRSATGPAPPAAPALVVGADAAAPPLGGRFPYAPGGDDLLISEEPLAAASTSAGGRARGAAVPEAADTPTGAAARPADAVPVRPPAQALPDLSAFPVAVAADFFGNGRTGLFVAVPDAGGVQRGLFLGVDRQGRWADRSGEMLADTERAACRFPREALAADLNGDGRPDVYLVCAAEPPAPCCRHWVYLSQPDGRYRRREVAAGWEGGTEVADLDGDGRVDVYATDTPAQVLWGRGDGSFAAEARRYGRK